MPKQKKSKMKILYFTPIPSPFQIEFIKEINSLSDDFQVKLVFSKPAPNDRLHWNAKFDGIVLQRRSISIIKKLLTDENPDCLLISEYNSPFGLYVRFWALQNKKAFFVGPKEMFLPDGLLKTYLKRLTFRLYVKRSGGIIAIGRQALLQFEKEYQGPIINIPYSFSLKNLLTTENEASQYDIRYLISGRLEDFRNPLMPIRCFAEVVKQNPGKKLLLVISGKGSLEQECIKLIDQLNIKNNVQWLNDFNDWYDIHTIYRKVDVLIAVQKHSGWGIIIQEAMASGLAIITSYNLAAANDLVINNYNGFIVQHNDSENIINRMTAYLNNRELINLHGLRSKEIVETIDVKNTATEFIEFVNKNLRNNETC